MQNLRASNYLDMLNNYLYPELLGCETISYFQQDGAPCHTSTVVKNWLDKVFPGSWIGKGGPVNWSPRSPDLSPLDFFIWPYLKSVVYASDTRDIHHLMVCIVSLRKFINRVHGGAI